MASSLADIAARFRGEPGSSLTLAVGRPGDTEERTLTITRRRIETRSVPYAFVSEPGIGYLRIARFGEHAGDEVAAAIDSLRAAGARALVLDLRDNPGGLVEQAIVSAAPLLREGALVATTKGRAAPPKEWLAPHSAVSVGWPVAVLVDGGSASAAEIVAGALQDHDRALLVGESTFGKATVQDFYPLRNHEGALRMTIAWYYTPSGRLLQRTPAGSLAEEDDGEDSPADSASADSAKSRPSFHTASGRVVHGGGVDPDMEVAPDSLGPLARAFEAQRLALAFAGGWVRSHGAQVNDGAREAFRAELARKGVPATDAAWTAEAPAVDRALRREFARREGGAAAAARVSLAGDPVYQRAASVLRRAKSPGDVFALAAGRAPAPAPRVTAPGVGSPHPAPASRPSLPKSR